MPRRKIPVDKGIAALESYLAASQLADISSDQLATAVRYLLEELAFRHPGSAVELRVPPFGATQLIDGPGHKRGTPANVVELAPEHFLALAVGQSSFEELKESGKLTASGNRSNLADLFPIFVS